MSLIARNERALENTAREVEAGGARALALAVDVADDRAVEAAATRVEAELGPIDVWVNVAMAAVLAPLSDTSAEDFRRVTLCDTHVGWCGRSLSDASRIGYGERVVVAVRALHARPQPLHPPGSPEEGRLA